MRKMGIITFHRANNYGAALQAYALQNTMENLGAKVEIIDYKNDLIFERYRIKNIKEIRNIKEFIKYIITIKDKKILKLKFENFYNNNYKLSKKYDASNINLANEHYDGFITGSDQVWNVNLHGNDQNYFLDFVSKSKKRYSYAGSFGTDKIKGYLDKNCIDNLMKFDLLSVREENGQGIIDELINMNSEVVLDPTLLLKRCEWEKLISNKKINYDYILIYKIADTPNLIKFSKMLAKKNRCKIVYIDNTYKKYFGMKNVKTSSPTEFLMLFRDAKFVVTSSFHGLAFSINFEKNFYYELDNRKENNNSRLENLAKKIGVENREIKHYKENFEKIDYTIIRNKLEKERNRSIDFLKNIIKEKA